MTVKVVQGLVGANSRLPIFEKQATQAEGSAPQAVAAQMHSAQLSAAAQTSTAGSEAVVTNLRSLNKGSITGDRKLNPEQADKLAKDVAERIRSKDGDELSDPHIGLDKVAASGSATNHLSA